MSLARVTGSAGVASRITRISAAARSLTARARSSRLPEEAAHALGARVREATRPYETPAGLEFPGVILLAAGRAQTAPSW
jgi:hypothetical protein